MSDRLEEIARLIRETDAAIRRTVAVLAPYSEQAMPKSLLVSLRSLKKRRERLQEELSK